MGPLKGITVTGCAMLESDVDSVAVGRARGGSNHQAQPLFNKSASMRIRMPA